MEPILSIMQRQLLIFHKPGSAPSRNICLNIYAALRIKHTSHDDSHRLIQPAPRKAFPDRPFFGVFPFPPGFNCVWHIRRVTDEKRTSTKDRIPLQEGFVKEVMFSKL